MVETGHTGKWCYMDHTSPRHCKEMIERHFLPNSCQYFISRKQSNLIKFPPAKICSTIMHSRFGLGGCSKGITSRWEAGQCTPWHQSHILLQLFSILAHVFSTISWIFLGMTPCRRANLGNLRTHRQNFYIRDHEWPLYFQRDITWWGCCLCVSYLWYSLYNLPAGENRVAGGFPCRAMAAGAGQAQCKRASSSHLELSEEKWVRHCSLSGLGLWL